MFTSTLLSTYIAQTLSQVVRRTIERKTKLFLERFSENVFAEGLETKGYNFKKFLTILGNILLLLLLLLLL